MLFLPGLITDGGSQMHPLPVGQDASEGANQHPQAALLQYVHVVVIGVPHGPPGGVPLGLLGVGPVDEPAVAVGPL